MPRAQPVPLRPAAEAASAQRPRRTRPRLVAIRVLRRRSPPVPPQTAPAPHRRLRPSLQSHKASPSTWRSHPSRVPLNHQPGDRPVSHGLNSDRPLTTWRDILYVPEEMDFSMAELTTLEQHALLAALRLDPNGYGVTIRGEIERHTGRAPSFASVYGALDRLV